MGRPRNPDQPCRVTINIPKSLLDQLKSEMQMSGKESLSGFIVSKITYAATSRHVSERNLTVIAELKSGTSFADVLRQLQMLNSTLQVKHVSGNLDFSGDQNGTVEAVIVPSNKPAVPIPDNIMAMSVFEIGLSVRASNTMKNGNIRTVGELSTKTVEDFRGILYCGQKTIKECQEKLLELGIQVNWI